MAAAQKRRVPHIRPPRDPAENIPGPLYIRRLLENGPRNGERISTWLRRLGGIQIARRFWVKMWKLFEAQRQDIEKAAGLSSSTMSTELGKAGLDPTTVFRMAFIADCEHDLELDLVEEIMNHVSK